MIKLHEIYISSFGKLKDYKLKLKDGINTVCRENGFGKSTIASFVKAIFFGFDESRSNDLNKNERKKFTPWDSNGKFGGHVKFSVDGKLYKAERYFGKTAKDDEFKLYDELDIVSKDYGADLGEKLFDINSDSFERCLYLPQKSVKVEANDSFLNKLQNLVDDTDDQNNFDSAYKKLDDYYKSLVSNSRSKNLSKKTQTESEIKEAKRELFKAQEDYVSAKSKQAQRLQNDGKLEDLNAQLKTLKEKQKQSDGMLALKNKAETFSRIEADFKAKEVRLKNLQNKCADVSAEYIDRCQQQILRHDELSQQISAASAQGEVKKASVANFVQLCFALLLTIAAIVLWDKIGQVAALCALAVAVILFIYSSLCFVRENGKQKQEKLRREYLQKLVGEKTAVEEDLRKTFDKHKIYENNFHSALTQLKNDKHAYDDADCQYKQAFAEWENKKKDPDYALVQNFNGAGVCDYSHAISQKEGEVLSIERENAGLDKEIEILLESADRISELSNALQALNDKLDETEAKAKLVAAAMQCLVKAKENLSRSFVPKIRDNFQQYISAVTDGKYANAVVDDKFNLQIEEGGKTREFDYFSKGTSDVAMFCLRLALIDAMYGDSPILILDDPFVNLDDDRYAVAMQILQKRAKNCQVLYFTCRR